MANKITRFTRLREQYDRLTTISLEEGFQYIRAGISPVIIQGGTVNVGLGSVRLQTFLHHGVKCNHPECNLTGQYFAVERGAQGAYKLFKGQPKPYHLNLWGTTPEGLEMLFTCDHVLARSLGGAHHIDNTQTLCYPHNMKKSKGESKEAVRLQKLLLKVAAATD